MYFILSKILTYLLYPIIWTLALLIWSLITKNPKKKKGLLIATVCFLYFFSNSYFFNLFARAWDTPPIPLDTVKSYSCAIILGGFINETDKKTGKFSFFADRFIQGAKLFEQKKTMHLLITGGNSSIGPDKQFKEADWVIKEYKDLNIPDSALINENNARNTQENALFSKQIIAKLGLPPPYILVTSAFHMRRSLYTFKKIDLDVIPYPCNYLTNQSGITVKDFIPSADVMMYWNLYIREVVGLAVYKIKN